MTITTCSPIARGRIKADAAPMGMPWMWTMLLDYRWPTHTVTRRRARPRWRHSARVGGGNRPVKAALRGVRVSSLARPGGNATGVNFFIAGLAAKRLGLLREMVSGMARVAVLVNPTNAANTESTIEDVQAAAPALELQIQIFNASTSREIDAAFANFVRERIDALFVGPDPFFNTRRVHLAVLASRLAIPATYAGRDYAEAGGLMSYGSDLADTYRQIGVYVGRILKGT